MQQVAVSASNQTPHLRPLCDVPQHDTLCDDDNLTKGMSHRSLDVRQHAGAVCPRSGVLPVFLSILFSSQKNDLHSGAAEEELSSTLDFSELVDTVS